MGVKLAAASGGSIELVPTNTASAFTVTVPAKTGTMAMDGPAFSAYAVGVTSLTQNVTTKVLFDTEEYDTNSNYASSRFTPTVAGYYQIASSVSYATAAAASVMFAYKNGASYKKLTNTNPSTVSSVSGGCQIFLNGSTDYVEIYVSQGAATQNTLTTTAVETWFQAAMVRSA